MLPQEFLERMENMLGEEYPAFLKSYDIARYQALRLNPQKGDDASFLNRMVFSLERVPFIFISLAVGFLWIITFLSLLL